MSDKISLEVGGKRFDHFLSYSVDADIFVADHAFSMEIANPEFDITPGQECRLYVNDQLELSGIIDRRHKRTDKQGTKVTIEGRDLMGLLVDSYCEEFRTVENITIKALAQMLMKDVPYVNRTTISGQLSLSGKIKTRRSRDAAYGLEAIMGTAGAERIAQIHPGMTKFQVLQMYALAAGVMFFLEYRGNKVFFTFDRPLVGGESDYTIIFNREGLGVNILSAELDENIAQRFSRVTVVGQRQGHADDGINPVVTNVGGPSGTVKDPSFPFYKPFVQLSHNDSQTPKQHARLLLEKMRHDGYRLSYEMPRHSINGVNFTINRLTTIKDTVHGVDGVFLVSGRTFKLDKQNGPTTTLRLAPPGLVEDGSKIGGGRK